MSISNRQYNNQTSQVHHSNSPPIGVAVSSKPKVTFAPNPTRKVEIKEIQEARLMPRYEYNSISRNSLDDDGIKTKKLILSKTPKPIDIQKIIN